MRYRGIHGNQQIQFREKCRGVGEILDLVPQIEHNAGQLDLLQIVTPRTFLQGDEIDAGQ